MTKIVTPSLIAPEQAATGCGTGRSGIMSASAAGEDTEGEEGLIVEDDDSGDDGAETPQPYSSASTFVDPNAVGTLFVAAGSEERAFRPAPSSGGDLQQQLTAGGDVSGLPSAPSAQRFGPSAGGSVLDASHAVEVGPRPASGHSGRRKARKPQSTRRLGGAAAPAPAAANFARSVHSSTKGHEKRPQPHKGAGGAGATAQRSAQAPAARLAPAPARSKARSSPSRGATSANLNGSAGAVRRRPRRGDDNGSDGSSSDGDPLPAALATMTERQLLQLVMARSAKEAEGSLGPEAGGSAKRGRPAVSPASGVGSTGHRVNGGPRAKRRRGSGSTGLNSTGHSQRSADSVVSCSEDGSDAEVSRGASRAEIAQAQRIIRVRARCARLLCGSAVLTRCPQSLQVRRQALRQLMPSPSFEGVVSGCFVRAREATRGGTVGRVYRVRGGSMHPVCGGGRKAASHSARLPLAARRQRAPQALFI